MPVPAHELSKLDPKAFEHMVNMLALKVLGAGHTGFGPGPDGGRDGYYLGSAPYPSERENWTGTWYIQSKFMLPTTGGKPQKWILDQIKKELAEFVDSDGDRQWPDNWIIATNIEPSGKPSTGAFDQAKGLVAKLRPELKSRFHVWGGRKILDLLAMYPDVAGYYAEFVTPGQVLTKLYETLGDRHANVTQIVRSLVVTQLVEQQYTRLEQAGSTTDNRPGIQRLFQDLPFVVPLTKIAGMAAADLSLAVAQNHKIDYSLSQSEKWRSWQLEPRRSRVWFIKGGPGQGKSTLTQFITQIQRAALILHSDGPLVTSPQRAIAEEIREYADKLNVWPGVPRIPVVVELKDFAQWYGRRAEVISSRVITYLAEKLAGALGQKVLPGTLLRSFSASRWLFVFDGLDEVPGDVKDAVAGEVTYFVDDALIGCGSDALTVCTSRPQGYSGQFNGLNASTIELTHLLPSQALACARPLLSIDRSESETEEYYRMLNEALSSESVRQLMTTPLQAHIMAVVVRDGGRPPDRKWQLYSNFYQTIKKREANRNLPDKRIATLLREEDQLLKALHNRLGFELHMRAETSENAVTSLDRSELERVVRMVVTQLKSIDVEATVKLLMEATTDRLVLVSTPETGSEVRFDIRPLQEFFAAEFLYDTPEIDVFANRLRIISGDSHWREVVHFLLSGLIENGRRAELTMAAGVLSGLNGTDDEQEIRTLAKRMALGGAVCARLLQEGVLEQDKRVRALLRTCISPLLGCTDVASVLSSAGPPQSASWLYDIVVNGMKEYSEPESIGAAVIATTLLPDGHPDEEQVVRFLSGASVPYRRCVISLAANNLARERRIPRWVSRFALAQVAHPQWLEIGTGGIKDCFRLLGGSSDVSAVARELGIPESVAGRLDALFASDRRLYKKRRGKLERERVCGVVEVEYVPPPNELVWQKWDAGTWEDWANTTGVLQAVSLAYRFIRSKSSQDEQKLSAFVGGFSGRTITDLFPPALATYFCSDPLGYELSACMGSSIRVAADHPGFDRLLMLIKGGESEVADWPAFFERHTRLAFWLAFGAHMGSRNSLTDFLSSPAGGRVLLNAARNRPGLVVSFSSAWGRLVNFRQVGPELRSIILAHAPQCAVSAANWITHDRADAVANFEVILPKEAELLPHIVHLCSSVAMAGRFVHDGSNYSVSDRFREAIAKYVPDFGAAVAVATDGNQRKRVRAAAAAVNMVHARTDSSCLVPPLPELLDLYEPPDGGWFISAIALALTSRIQSGDSDARAVISALLDRSRADYAARTELDTILADWREIARAPVHAVSDPKLWE